ncbi:MAG: tetratricopeptide repeat protein [Chloroflexi bacterium]|nr:tetratricopeptide repeat protein [Chloroflexota bacterium]
MSVRRLIAWIAVFVSVALALLGIVVFVLGVAIEFASGMTQPLDPYLSPVAQLSLAGLCLSASMIVLGFLLVGILLARQSRQYGAGYGEAYRLIQKLQFPQAIQLLERVLAGGKITPDLLMLLTSAYAYNGQLAKAQATADQAVQMFPQNAAAYMTLANGYRMQASYGEAAMALQTAAQLSPDQPIIWAELGFIQQLAGEHDSAIESFKHAVLYSMPSMYSVRVNYYLSQHYLKVGDSKNAISATERMISTKHGLQAWKSTLSALEGTAYGSLLNYEIEKIERAITDTEEQQQ